MPHCDAASLPQGGPEDRDRAGYLLPVPQGQARTDPPLGSHAAARRQDDLLELSQSARQRDGSSAEGKFDQRHLLQMPCRKARPVPVRARAGTGELPELPRSARQQQRIHAENIKAAAVRRMPWLWSRLPDQRTQDRGDVRALVPELSCAGPWKQQSFGSIAPEIDANVELRIIRGTVSASDRFGR